MAKAVEAVRRALRKYAIDLLLAILFAFIGLLVVESIFGAIPEDELHPPRVWHVGLTPPESHPDIAQNTYFGQCRSFVVS